MTRVRQQRPFKVYALSAKTQNVGRNELERF